MVVTTIACILIHLIPQIGILYIIESHLSPSTCYVSLKFYFTTTTLFIFSFNIPQCHFKSNLSFLNLFYTHT